MIKRISTLILLFVVFGIVQIAAQVVQTSPAIVQEDSKDIVITFFASQGNAGMKGSTNCYAHTGVITDRSANDSDWRYAPTWGDNSDKYKLKLKGTNKFQLTISDIREYYGITDPNEKVLKLAFVFRNADCSKEGKNADGSDILVNVFSSGLAIDLTADKSNGIVPASSGNVNFSVATSSAADIRLFVNSTSTAPVASVDNAMQLSAAYTFAEGDYKVIAQATADGQIVTKEMNICSRRESQMAEAPTSVKKGTQINADGSVTFYLYAPGKSNVMLFGEWNDYVPTNAQVMNHDGENYFYTTVNGLDMDKEYAYYFLVDDNVIVADPYAKLVLDPWNDKYINESATIYPDLKPFPTAKVGNNIVAVFHGNENDYDWDVKSFAGVAQKDLLVYEILLRDFTDAKSLAGAIEKLDYVKSLGVNAVELMPVFEFSGNNSWGYNPSFYFAPDKAYGNKAAYKRFVDECHKRGLAVIVDVVFNHATGDHPWCKMYWNAATGKPSADNPFFNVDAPHNWSVFNDWRMENEVVKDYFCDVLKYWISEYKIDGYRFDLAKGFGDSDSYGSDYDASGYNASRLETTKRFTNAIISANPNAYAIFEYFVSSVEEDALAKAGGISWNNLNSAGNQYAAGLSSGSGISYGYKENRISYLESHDEERNAYFQATNGVVGVKGNLAASMRRLGANAAMFLMLPGAKMLWQFEEMGYDVSINDGGRTDAKPTHWEYLDNAERKGLFTSMSEVMNLRKRLTADLYNGGEFKVNAGPSDWEQGRFLTARNKAKNIEVVVAVNPTTSDLTVNYSFDNPGAEYYIYSKSHDTTPIVNSSTGKIFIPANGYVVVTNRDFSGVESNVVDNSVVSVYPNPATDVVYIDSQDVESIEVYSISGQLVGKNKDANSINVSNLAKGNYILRISTADSTFTTKLIKK